MLNKQDNVYIILNRYNYKPYMEFSIPYLELVKLLLDVNVLPLGKRLNNDVLLTRHYLCTFQRGTVLLACSNINLLTISIFLFLKCLRGMTTWHLLNINLLTRCVLWHCQHDILPTQLKIRLLSARFQPITELRHYVF